MAVAPRFSSSSSSSSFSKTLNPSTPKTSFISNSQTTFTSSKTTQLRFNPPKFESPLVNNAHRSKLTTVQSQGSYKYSNYNPIQCLFTGIVEEIGEIKQLGYADNGGGFEMKISAKTVLGGVNLGDSIAVNGTCLTVTEFNTNASEFSVGIAPETLRKTSLIELESGSVVNLERALLPTTRMGGHFVQGHVDGTGEIVSMVPEGDSLWVKIKTSPEILKFIVPKGFIAIDGTSLTVVNVFDEEECFNIMMVAYSQQNVVIPLKKVGQKVNLEVDILGKYVERLLQSGFTSNKIASSS